MSMLYKFSIFLFKNIRYKLFIWIVLLSIATILEGISFVFFIPLFRIVFNDSNAEIPLKIYFIFNIINNTVGSFDFFNILLIIIVFFLLRSILLILQSIYINRVIRKLNINIISDLIARITECSYQFFISYHLSKFYNITITEIRNINIASEQYILVISNLFIFILYLGIAILINPIYAIISLFFVPICIMYLYINIKIKSNSRKITNNNSTLQNYITQFLSNFQYFKLINTDNYLSKKMFSSIDEREYFSYKNRLLNYISGNITQYIFIVLFCVILYIQKIFLHASIMEVLILIFVFTRVIDRMYKLFNAYMLFNDKYGSIELYNDLYHKLTENGDYSNNIIPDFKSSIVLQNIDYSYDNKKLILNNINLEIKANSTTIISGKSGVGKSTLINIIIGLLRPTNGNIYIGNVNYRDINLDILHNSVGFLSQNNVIFNDTLHNNITLWNTSILDNNLKDDIDKVLQSISLPNNYNIEINGNNISGGQLQRIQFIRELYKKPKILILDEISNNLDNESINLIKNILDNLRGKITIIIIDHHPKLLECYDENFVVHDQTVKI